MKAPTIITSPQQISPATPLEGNQVVVTGKPTFDGPPPAGFERMFDPAPDGRLPEFAPLPSPGKRCPFSGGSRSWLLEHGEAGNFKLCRIRQKGKARGKVLIHVPSLLEWLRREMAGQTEPGDKGGQP